MCIFVLLQCADLEDWPPCYGAPLQLPVHMTIPIPKATDQLLVCNRSSNLYITTESGEVLKTLTSGKSRGGDFLSCHISPKVSQRCVCMWLCMLSE